MGDIYKWVNAYIFEDVSGVNTDIRKHKHKDAYVVLEEIKYFMNIEATKCYPNLKLMYRKI